MRAVRREDTRRRARRRALSTVAVVAALLLARWAGDGDTDPAPANRAEAERAGDPAGEGLNPARRSDPRRDTTEAAAGYEDDSAVRRDTAGVAPDDGREDSPADDEKRARDAVEPIYLEPLVLTGGGPTLAISGFDPYAPRELVAWRILHGRSAIMSRGSSDLGGAIHFPEILAPRDGFEVVVGEAGLAPQARGASLRRRLAPRAPAAPQGQILGTAGEYRLHIVPTETTGAVLLADFTGNVFASYDVPADPAPSNQVIDVALTLPATDTEIWLAHRLKDGRVSEWRVLPLERLDFDSQSGP